MTTATTTKMASEYHHSSSFSNTNRFNSYKSNAFCAPRMGSQRLKAREPPPSVPVVAATTQTNVRAYNNHIRDTTEHKLNTINLMKSIKSSQLAATKSTTTTAIALAKPTKPSSTTTVNAFTLGSNKSYYSSTRSFSSKIVEKSKMALAVPHVDKSCGQLSTSSGTSSIESIVPKYNGFVSGSKKRIYSSVRVTKKEMPSCHSDGIVTVNAAKYASTTVKFTANKKQMKENDSDRCRTIETLTSNLCSSSTTSTSSYSTKFPNGLPFEDEFYTKRRNSTSTKSEVSDYGSYENEYDDDNDADRQSLLPFEDEFARQRPSSNDEALYVDFSKPIARNRNNDANHDAHEHSGHDNSHFGHCNGSTNMKIIKNNLKNETKSCSNRNYVCNPDEVIIRDQPVVYVAVQWWASATNNCDHNTTTNASHGHYDCNVAEPIRTNLM